MTRIEFKRKYDEVCFSVGKYEGGGAFPSHAHTEREQRVAEDREIKNSGMG